MIKRNRIGATVDFPPILEARIRYRVENRSSM